MIVTIESFENSAVKNWWQDIFCSGKLLTNTIFQSWEWNHHWWKTFGQENSSRELFLLVLWNNQTILAIAPLFIQHKYLWSKNLWSKIFWIAFDYSDYPDLITTNEQLNLKWKYFLDFITEEKNNCWIEVWDIFRTSSIYQLNKSEHGFRWEKGRGNIYLFLELPDDFSTFVNSLSIQFQKKIKQQENQLNKLGKLEWRIYPGNSIEAHKWLQKFIAGKYEDRSFYQDKNNRMFIENLLNDNNFSSKVFFSVLSLDSLILSALMFFDHDETIYFYLSGFNSQYKTYSPSTLNIYSLIRYAILHGYKRFDFLRGTEQYKYRWGIKEVVSEHWYGVPSHLYLKYNLIKMVRTVRNLFGILL